MINQEFFNYLKPYLKKLKEQIGADFVVFGSTPLYLLGVVEFNGKINDLDVCLKDISKVPKDTRKVTFQGQELQNFYKLKIDDMDVDIGGIWPGYEDFFDKIFTNPVVVDGFKFANLEVVKAFKEKMYQEYKREKDKKYLEKIKQYQSNN